MPAFGLSQAAVRMVKDKISMVDIELSRALFSLLDGDEAFAQRNFHVCMIDGSDVAVKWKGHLRGVWSEAGGQLNWTPAGHSQPNLRVATVKEALRYTLEVVAGIGS